MSFHTKKSFCCFTEETSGRVEANSFIVQKFTLIFNMLWHTMHSVVSLWSIQIEIQIIWSSLFPIILNAVLSRFSKWLELSSAAIIIITIIMFCVLMKYNTISDSAFLLSMSLCNLLLYYLNYLIFTLLHVRINI